MTTARSVLLLLLIGGCGTSEPPPGQPSPATGSPTSSTSTTTTTTTWSTGGTTTTPATTTPVETEPHTLVQPAVTEPGWFAGASCTAIGLVDEWLDGVVDEVVFQSVDPEGRLLEDSRVNPANDGETAWDTWTWRPDGQPLTHAWDRPGASGPWLDSWTYDADDQEIERVRTEDGALLETVTTTWQDGLRVSQLDDVFPGGPDVTTTWTYDAYDRIATVSESNGRTGTYSWLALGEPDHDITFDWGDGVADQLQIHRFDANGEPTLIRHVDLDPYPGYSPVTHEESWVRGPAGTPLHYSESSGSGFAWSSSGTTYGWDANGRLYWTLKADWWDTGPLETETEWTWTCP